MENVIGANLRRLREREKISLFKLAIKTGITDRYLQRIEKGKHQNPSMEILIKLADFFGVSLDGLVGRKPPKKGKDIIMLPLDRLGKKAEHYR